MPSFFTFFNPSRARWLTPLLLSALGLTLLWDALGLDQWVMAAIGTPTGFPLRKHQLLTVVLHDRLKDCLLVVYILAWLTVIWPMGPMRHLSARQRWMALAGVTVSLIVVSSLKRFSATSCPWDWQAFGGQAHPLSHWAWGVFDGGPGHCFPGGHASSALAFLSLAWVGMTAESVAARRWGRRLLWAVLALGVLMGTVQTLKGAHPPSHTLWTGWICAALAWGTARLASPRSMLVAARV
jgi:membrane-associated PAP2 superfamily phosphatase